MLGHKQYNARRSRLTSYRRRVVVVWLRDLRDDGALRVKVVADGIADLAQAFFPRLWIHRTPVVGTGRDEEQHHLLIHLQRD